MPLTNTGNEEDSNAAILAPATALQQTNEEKYGQWNGKILSQFNRFMRVSVVTLNQWAMDFDGNLKRVIESVKQAHKQGSTIRVGVELELSGYSCLDHFYEKDTETHCWESLIELLRFSKDLNMIIVTGMPVRFRAAIYNCMVVCAKGKIILIHPKNAMCDDDVYRESRYFKSWKHGTKLQMFNVKQHGIDQDDVPFGHGIVETLDGVKIAIEICEEMWAATSPSVLWALNGVDIICNGSASHHVLGKSAKRICQLVQDLSTKLGGVYLYSNLRGFDGDRIYFDGMSAIVQNGKIYKQIAQFDLEDVAVESALLDLNKSATYRTKIASLSELSSRAELLSTITANIEVVQPHDNNLDAPIVQTFYTEREEIFQAPPAYLWHYLRRSNAAGYFLPLSGGADSCATAAIIYLMCEKVCQHIATYKEKGIPLDPSLYFQGKPLEETDPKKLCSRLFYTCYMKSKNSSKETEQRAQAIADSIGANFTVQSIDATVESLKETFSKAHEVNLTHEHPDYRARLALENIQARARMVLAYMNAQLLPVTNGLEGYLLVLGSSNVDESLVGYLTKYDCSSADINPIGSINKIDLKMFLKDFADRGFAPFHDVVAAKPSAELRPSLGVSPQSDEEEIGITYAQLHEIGLLRKPGYYGLFSTFFQLVSRWKNMIPVDVSEIVINFYTRYIKSRHKATVSTPALVSNVYCVDDQRTDHRPFVYPTMAHQFQRLRDIAKTMSEK
uniref:Glutamine-dependent NAD(+) synthetase n=1 Tax=Panagrolaimus davidi TaxID=227884 RepID=A0A914QFA9_9BILA